MSYSIDLSGRVALVTGASSGLGLQFAKVLAKAGAGVVLAGRRIERLKALRAEIEADGGDAHVVALDVTDHNPRQIQISAPVQQGNSGGPLLDLHGHVVGVIVSKLNAQRIAQATGDIPQNVNFAVKHTEAVDFMREHGVQPQLEDPATAPLRTAAEIGEVAHASTVFLRCLR